ncbi:MAG: cation transporter [Elusimicrobia bacterium]|jgi:cobalt-zinc-cadmium efflux system protein|nr:cation transporter [Elusimicrobiota bacterium]MBL0058418.1 cation transporter [Elusimicrobiota bacterium]
MSHDHAASAGGRNKERLLIVFALTSAVMLAEAAGGFFTHSLALLADAAHMLADAGALGLSLLAMRFAERPANQRKSYGYHRAEILAAFVNASILLLMSVLILIEAWERLRHPLEVMSGPMLGIAVVGLIVNLVGMRLLFHGAKESLNVKGAYLEVLSDALGSIGVIAAAAIMWRTRWYAADPIVSAAIGLFIVPRTWTLLKQAVHILMEGVPAHIDVNALEAAMKRVPNVCSVHDLHVWTITSGFDALSAHVDVDDPARGDRILADLRRVLKEEFEINHTTLQLEIVRCPEDTHS